MDCKERVAYINIGSNMGERQALIEKAVSMIERLCGNPARRSALIESKSWGYASEKLYLNLGISVGTSLPALDLFKGLQAIQNSISPASHRDDKGGYADRLIDIDLIALDELVVDSPHLQLPHPRMHLREFVLRPMAELAPQWRHPLLNATAGELLCSLEQGVQHLD